MQERKEFERVIREQAERAQAEHGIGRLIQDMRQCAEIGGEGMAEQNGPVHIGRLSYCEICGCDMQVSINAQLIALKRFDHRHDCPNSPSYQFRRRLAILRSATELYPFEFQLAQDEDEGITSAIDIAEKIWREIERREDLDRNGAQH